MPPSVVRIANDDSSNCDKSISSFTTLKTEKSETSCTPRNRRKSTYKSINLSYAESYYEHSDFENAEYYYLEHLNEVKKKLPSNDDVVITAYERLADAQVGRGKKLDAVGNYRKAVHELRLLAKKEPQPHESNSSLYVEELRKKYEEALVHLGNTLLYVVNEAEKKDRRIIEYCNEAIECFNEALPLVKENHELLNPLSTQFARRFCRARDFLASHLVSMKKINLAITQYNEILNLLEPYMKELYEKRHNKQLNDYYKELKYFYFKHTLNLGHLHLQKQYYDILLHVFESALKFTGLSNNDIGIKTLSALDPRLQSLISTILHNMGVAYQRKNMCSEAVIQFERVVFLKKSKGSNPGSSLLGLGEAYYTLEQYEKSLENLLEAEQTLQIDETISYKTTHEKCYRLLSTIYYNLQDYEKAIEYLKKEISYLHRCLDGEHEMLKVSAACYQLACIHYDLGDYDEALDVHMEALCFKNKIGDNHQITMSLQKIGETYIALGNFDLAISNYEDALDISNHKQKIDIHFSYGESLTKMNNDLAAMEQYNFCIALAEADDILQNSLRTVINSSFRLGDLLIKFGENEKAIIKYKHILKRIENKHVKEEVELNLALGKAYEDINNYEEAMKFFQTAKRKLPKRDFIQLYPEFKSCHISISLLQEKMNEVENSVISLKGLILLIKQSLKDEKEIELEQIQILQEIASIQFRNRRYDDALRSNTEILSRKRAFYRAEISNHKETEDISISLLNIGEVYYQKKMYEEALRSFNEALEHDDDLKRALIHCSIGKVQVVMFCLKEARDSFTLAKSLLGDGEDKEVHLLKSFRLNKSARSNLILDEATLNKKNEGLLTVLRHMGAFYLSLYRFDEAAECYQKAFSSLDKNDPIDFEDTITYLVRYQLQFQTNIKAFQFLELSKRKQKIDNFCATFEDFEHLVSKMLQLFSVRKDFISCISCLKALINVVQLFYNDGDMLRIKIVQILHDISSFYCEYKRFNDAIKSNKVALYLNKSIFSENNVIISESYERIGESYLKKGDYQKALNYFRLSLGGADEKTKLILLDKVSYCLSKTSTLDVAIESYKYAIFLCGDKNSDLRAMLLNNMGNLLLVNGDTDEATACYVQANLEVQNLKNGEDEENFLFNLGSLSFKNGNYMKSLKIFKRLLIALVKKGSFDAKLASILNCIGVIQLKYFRSHEAISWLEQSFNLLEVLLIKNPEQTFNVLTNLACAQYRSRKYKRSYLSFQKAKKLLISIGKQNDERALVLQYKCASCSFKKRDYNTALIEYKKALKMNKVFGSKSIEIIIKHNCALTLCKQQLYDSAMETLNDIYKQKLNIYSERHPEVAKICIDLGNIYFIKGEIEMAADLCKKASEILDNTEFPPSHIYLKQLKRLKKKLQEASSSLRAMEKMTASGSTA